MSTAAIAAPATANIIPGQPHDGTLHERLGRVAATRGIRRKPANRSNDKRSARRRSTTLPATVIFPDIGVRVNCTILDMSTTGARLKLPPSRATAHGDVSTLPTACTLVLRADRVEVPCHMMWAHETSIGVRFAGAPTPILKR